MRKLIKVLMVSCLCTSFAGGVTAYAALDLETEASAAGISVVLNNYYAGSLNPEAELAVALSSPDTFAVKAESSPMTDVPMVTSTASAYENVAVSQVSNYVNVRSEPNTTSTVVGKIYNNCAATILATVDGEGGQWYQIQSGSVTGYIKAEYFVTGSEAEAIARQVGTSMARVSHTSTLRLREQPNLESKTLDLLSPEAEYEVVGEEGDFYKISVDTDLQGYVSKDYIDIRVEFDTAVSLAEEQAQAAESQRLKIEAEQAIKEMEKVKAEAQNAAAAAPTTTTSEPTAAPESTAAPATVEETIGIIPANPDGSTSAPTAATQTPATAGSGTVTPPANPGSENLEAGQTGGPGGSGNSGSSQGSSGSSGKGTSAGPSSGKGPGSAEVTSATRTAIVAYAKQFLGNPYVYGGTSLTNGVDCSGFTQEVYKHFGITTGRSSRDQAANGREIAVSDIQPGDLLFYASGDYINHVAMYIGNDQVIHASTPSTGIKISPYNYRTPCKAVTFLD